MLYNRNRYDKFDKCDCDHHDYNDDRNHNHEFLGSTNISGPREHNHRFSGTTSRAIQYGRGHYHVFEEDTDTFGNHHHDLRGRTGPAIEVGDGKHIHFAENATSFNAGHRHLFEFATLIENPSEDEDYYY